MARLSGKVALVTGGGSGIGAETARRFRDEGAIVVTGDLKGGDLELDVTSPPSVTAAMSEIRERHGGLDVVVNNAGVTIVGAVHELAEADWDRELATNLKSVYLVSKAAWPLLRERGGGSILSTASIAGLWAIPDDAAYCASKAGVVMLTKCMALDGAKDGIRVNCVCPGFTETPMIEGYFDAQPDPTEARRFAERLHPLGRLGRPRDIADAFVYLASDEAAWVTGTALVVDGGLTSGIWGG
jgi:NAD(P)-dependent dehydrogenase (short-subunit alcohol dehydrogenase family)